MNHQQRQTEYTAQLNGLRATVNEHELSFNENKKRFKYEIQLDQEKQLLDYIDNDNELGPGLDHEKI